MQLGRSEWRWRRLYNALILTLTPGCFGKRHKRSEKSDKGDETSRVERGPSKIESELSRSHFVSCFGRKKSRRNNNETAATCAERAFTSVGHIAQWGINQCCWSCEQVKQERSCNSGNDDNMQEEQGNDLIEHAWTWAKIYCSQQADKLGKSGKYTSFCTHYLGQVDADWEECLLFWNVYFLSPPVTFLKHN